MIKVERSPVAPASLASEAKKKHGSYRESDVLNQLEKDFYGKCYVCEIKPVQDPQVEHRLPHHNRIIPERVFDWNNLFYSCPHCNSVKNAGRYEEGIIDCCVRDPEELLKYQLIENHVQVMVKDKTDLEAIRTAELIEDVFNSTSTGIRTIAGQVRLNDLQLTMDTFYKLLERCESDPTDKKAARMLNALLNRASKFSGFTRSYAKEHGYL